MKLSSQINTGMLCLILSAFIASLFYELYSFKQHQVSLVEGQAAHTASTLSVAFSPDEALQQSDRTTLINNLLAAVVVHPYIAQAKYEDNRSDSIITQSHDNMPDTPAWFTSLLPLERIHKKVKVDQENGYVSLTSDRAYSYSALWTTFTKYAFISGLLLITSISMISVITALAVRPVKRSTKRLAALQNHDYSQANITSFTKDYRYLAHAVNSLVSTLEQRFNQLSKQTEQFKLVANKDTLTGLSNRSAFERHMTALLSKSKSIKEMDLTLIRLANLSRINSTLGTLAGDSYVVGIANVLQRISTESLSNAFVFRLSGGDFAVICETVPREEHENILRTIVRLAVDVYPLQDDKKAVSIGVARFNQSESLSHIVEKADNALIAATKLEQRWQFASDIKHVHSSAKWRERLTYIVEQQYADILIQPIMNIERNAPAYHEVFARFKDKQSGDVIPMSQLIPASERLELIPQLDKLVVNMVLKKMSATTHQVGINLSNMSIANTRFTEWLVEQMKQREDVCHRLIFEIEDSALIHHSQDTVQLCKQLMACGARITIEHFGDNFSSLAGLRAIAPQFVKLSGRLTQNIHIQKDNQLFISSLLSIARSLNVNVIAEMVENEAESVALDNLEVVHQQGYFFAKPTLWTVY